MDSYGTTVRISPVKPTGDDTKVWSRWIDLLRKATKDGIYKKESKEV
jgi:hypothetical protein